MKKTQKLLFSILLMATTISRVLSAIPDPGQLPKKCESYDLTEEVSYLIDPNRELKLSEQLKYRPSRIVKHVEKCNDSQITTVLNPSEVWQSWMTQPVKTVLDAMGVSYYDAEGKLLYQYSSAELAPGQELEFSWEDEVVFELNDRIYASAAKNNAQIIQTETGFQMKGDGFLLEVNQRDLLTILTFFENGEYVGSEKVIYRLSEGRPTKQYKVNRSVEGQTDGTKVEKIVVSTYSNYKTT